MGTFTTRLPSARRHPDSRSGRGTLGSHPGCAALPLGQDDHGDHGREEQQRAGLEGQRRSAEQEPSADRVEVVDAGLRDQMPATAAAASPPAPAGFRPTMKTTSRSSANPAEPPAIASRRLPEGAGRLGVELLVAEVQQHDDEQEQHHDGAGVDQELRRRQELEARPGGRCPPGRRSAPSSDSTLKSGFCADDHADRGSDGSGARR